MILEYVSNFFIYISLTAFKCLPLCLSSVFFKNRKAIVDAYLFHVYLLLILITRKHTTTV